MTATAAISRTLHRLSAPGITPSAWQETMQRACRWVSAVVLVLHCLTLAPIVAQGASPLTTFAVALLVLTLVIVAIDTGYGSLFVKEPTGLAHLSAYAVTALVACMVAAVLATPAGSGPPPWLGLAPPLLVGYAAASSPRRLAPLVVVLLAGVVPAIMALRGEPTWGDERVRGLALLLVVGGTSTLLVFRALRRCGIAAESWVETAIAASMREEATQEGERRTREVARFVHDEVLHVLQVIAMAPGMPPGSVRALASQALARFDMVTQSSMGSVTGALANSGLAVGSPGSESVGAAGGGAVVDLVSEVVALLTDLAPRATCLASQDVVAVPRRVGDALVGSTAEAIRNAQRHSGAPETLTVSVSLDGEAVAVNVRDRGVGFDVDATDAVGRGRHGVRDSIVRRMQDVEGDAEVLSDAGVGTVVMLTWRPRPLARVAGGPVVAGGMLAGAVTELASCMVPFVAWLIDGVVTYAPSFDRPSLVFMATALVISGGAVAVWFAARGGPGPLAAACLSALTVSAIALTGAAIGSATLGSPEMFVLGPSTGLLIFAMTYRPLRETVWWAVLACVAAAVTCAHAAGDSHRYGELAPAMASVVLAVSAGAVFRAVMDSYGRSARRSADSIARSRAAEVAHVARQEAAHSDLADVIDLARPLLVGVASGDLSLDEPATARAARELEGQLRAGLALPASPNTLRAIAALRAQGWALTVRADEALPTQEDAHVGTLLDALARSGEVGRIDLRVLSGSTRSSVSAVITPPSKRIWKAISLCVAQGVGRVQWEEGYVQFTLTRHHASAIMTREGAASGSAGARATPSLNRGTIGALRR